MSNQITIIIHIDENQYQLQLDPSIADHANELYNKMDKDMDHGWRVNERFVENPDALLRSQIVADKLLTALEQGNKSLIQAMLGYIISRKPDTRTLKIDNTGDPQNTQFINEHGIEID